MTGSASNRWRQARIHVVNQTESSTDEGHCIKLEKKGSTPEVLVKVQINCEVVESSGRHWTDIVQVWPRLAESRPRGKVTPLPAHPKSRQVFSLEATLCCVWEGSANSQHQCTNNCRYSVSPTLKQSGKQAFSCLC